MDQAVNQEGLRVVPDEPGHAAVSAAGDPATEPELVLWHVRVTLAGEPVDPERLRRGLEVMCADGVFLGSVGYAADRVELTYWDEAEDVDDAAALALRVWNDHRQAAELPSWTVVGLEVLDRDIQRARGRDSSMAVGDVRPL